MKRVQLLLVLMYITMPQCSGDANAVCTCMGLTCRCCVTVDSNNACLIATFVPSDLMLNINLEANGRTVYKTKIDAGNFPICPPITPPICWAFNHIHLEQDNLQVCSEIRIGPIPVSKVPCLSYTNGTVSISPNSY